MDTVSQIRPSIDLLSKTQASHENGAKLPLEVTDTFKKS
jgi:hypothetical protein